MVSFMVAHLSAYLIRAAFPVLSTFKPQQAFRPSTGQWRRSGWLAAWAIGHATRRVLVRESPEWMAVRPANIIVLSVGATAGGSTYSDEMTTFHAFLGASLDGFIAGPQGELNWLVEFDESLGDSGYDEFFRSVDAMVMGRVSYDVMRQSNPGFYKDTPVHVLSRTLPPDLQPDLGQSPVTVHTDIPALRASLWQGSPA